MRKKIFSTVIAIILCFSVLAGCNLVEHNYEKDYKQVIAKINAITYVSETDSSKTFTSEAKNIYKYQLVNSWMSDAEKLITENGMTAEQAADYLLNQLIIRELYLNDVDKMMEFGDITWFDGDKDYSDSNRVSELVYEAIDSSITSIVNDQYTAKGYELATIDTSEDETTTTYPTKPVDDADIEDGHVAEEEPFVPNADKWISKISPDDVRSVEKQAMSRLISLFAEKVADDYMVTKEDKKKFKEDDTLIAAAVKNGMEFVYPMIGQTHYAYYLLGKSAKEQVKIEKLQEYLTDAVTVSDTEIKSDYNDLILAQKESYVDIANYDKAMQDSATTVYVHPNSNYFYVKHILLPFSAEQTAKLEGFVADKNLIAAGVSKQQQKLDFRTRMVDGIVAYPHVNGEDDKTKPMTVQTIFNEIKVNMSPLKNSVKEAERKFDDYIYLYNTDTGIFGNAKGYNVRREIKTTETERYQPEFSKAARELLAYSPGEVLPTYAVTDFGVHIMYFASEVNANIDIRLTDYESPAEYKMYNNVLKDAIQKTKEEKAFTDWQQDKINYYTNVDKQFEIFKNKFKEIYTT